MINADKAGTMYIFFNEFNLKSLAHTPQSNFEKVLTTRIRPFFGGLKCHSKVDDLIRTSRDP